MYITSHGLCHTHCSLLFEGAASIKEVRFRLDHRDVKTTLGVYAHVTKKRSLKQSISLRTS
ncbi:tyrosine-type recombinase/integrase [Exiguobacterium sp. TDN 0502]|uniref:tyrosine-type recombinase/integrase n=1 Tax=Exiguobacterium sp. TDN 0502 TaxID=3420731 RepID=UPI003D77E786